MSDWKYDVDEVGEDAEPDGDSDADAGPIEVEPEPLEPGSPTAENAFFVVLGVATTLFVFAQIVLLAAG
jgi:hypothetical protein